MWPYWLMFLLPTAAALMAPKHEVSATSETRSVQLSFAWVLMTLFLTLMIGYRFRVGGDWINYFHYLDDVRGLRLHQVLLLDDPGYHLLNWLSAERGWGIFGVNLIGGGIFSVGLAVFCHHLPRPWLALVVAVPYTVIVLAMGYSRQAIALGLAMLGLVALGRKSMLWFVFWVVLGATFHKTAVVLLPIAALATTHNRFWTALWLGVVALLAYMLLLQDSAESLYVNYIEARYQSEGALIRLLMNAVPAAILLCWRQRFEFTRAEASLWSWFAIISVVLLGGFLVSPSSTAVDRMALYMLPLQMVVFSHLPDVIGRKSNSSNAWSAVVVLYYATVQFVWLNYAQHAFLWLPYRFYPLEAWF